jgi:nucleoid DNA-binding protein
MADDEKKTDETAGENELGKEKIYERIGQFVVDKTSKRIGKTGGREIFDMVVEGIFELATANKTVRLNGGFGSFHVRDYGKGTRRLPSGTQVEFDERSKLRYDEGVVVKELVKNGGNLQEALKARGVRGANKDPADKKAA